MDWNIHMADLVDRHYSMNYEQMMSKKDQSLSEQYKEYKRLNRPLWSKGEWVENTWSDPERNEQTKTNLMEDIFKSEQETYRKRMFLSEEQR